MDGGLARPRALEWAPGHRFEGYQILRELGRGGMAVVYLACQLDPAPRRLVAIKRVLPHLAGEQRFVELFLNEARLTFKLTHPNTLRVLDFGTSNDEHYMVLDFVHGVDLRDLLRDCARGSVRLPLACGLYVVGAVARGLHDAHIMRGPDGVPLGLVHRDVTPSNVMIGYDGSVRLGDFGVAKALALSQTRSMSLKGKVAYMSPEQCSGDPIDRRSDVFALGVLCWEVSLGRRLFRGSNEFHIMNQVVSGKIRRPSEEDPDYPPELEAIVLEALHTDPDQRYQTAQELVDALGAFARAQQLEASSNDLREFMLGIYGEQEPPSMPVVSPRAVIEELTTTTMDALDIEPVPVPSRRSRGLVIVGLAVGLCGVFAAGYMLNKGQGPAEAPERESSALAPDSPVVEVPAPVPADADPPVVEPATVAPPTVELLEPTEADTPSASEVEEPSRPPTGRSRPKKQRPSKRKRKRLDEVELTNEERNSMYAP